MARNVARENAGGLSRQALFTHGLPRNITATSNPGVNDDINGGYDVGSIWVNVSADRVYFCADSSDGAAVWALTASSAVTEITALSDADSNFIVGNGSAWVAESGATARTSLGLGTAAVAATGISNTNVPVFTSGVADNDFLRVDGTSVEGLSAAEVAAAIEGSIDAVGTIASGTWEGTTIAVAQGGTGATSLSNLITLATHTTGDYVQNITGGTGIDSTGATSGENIAHSLSIDLAEVGEVAIANGDYIAFMDATDSNATKKEALADVATLFAGTGLTASSSVIGVDASQTQITSVGTIGTGVWEGTTVAVAQGGTGATSLSNLITLATHTTGDYVQNITAGTGLTSSGGTSGENIAHSLSVDASQTQVTSVGALNAGSITSGFTSIDVGAGAIAGGSFDASDGNITSVGDIALDSISADATDISIAVTDNSATALTVLQGSDAYLIIDTANSSESVSIGTGISGTAIAIGHGTSETTFGDNVTITGDLTINGAQVTNATTNLTIVDPLVKYGQAYVGSAYDQGFVVTRGNSVASNTQNMAFIWDESEDEFATIKAATEDGTTAGNVTVTDHVNLHVGALVANDTSTFSGSIELGHASDTTITRASSGDITIEGNAVYRAGGTDVAIADGGTGQSNLTDLITLTTHTTGNYVATVTAGTGLTSTGATTGEGIAHGLSVDAAQTGITSIGTQAANLAVGNGYGVVIGTATQETVSIGDGATDLVPELQVLGTAAADSSILLAAFSTTATTAGSPILAFAKGGNATLGSHTVVTDGEELGNIIAFGDDGTDLETPAASIQFEVDGTPGSGDMPGRIVFSTTADGATAVTERLRIGATGLATFANGFAVGSDAEGDILYSNGTNYVRLAKGSDNQTLTMDGNVPNWETAGTGITAGFAIAMAIAL